MNHFAAMAPRPDTKQCLTNVEQVSNESNRAYLKRIDKLILEGEPLGDEAKLLGSVVGLKKGTKLWRHMTSNYPTSYSEFRT